MWCGVAISIADSGSWTCCLGAERLSPLNNVLFQPTQMFNCDIFDLGIWAKDEVHDLHVDLMSFRKMSRGVSVRYQQNSL